MKSGGVAALDLPGTWIRNRDHKKIGAGLCPDFETPSTYESVS